MASRRCHIQSKSALGRRRKIRRRMTTSGRSSTKRRTPAHHPALLIFILGCCWTASVIDFSHAFIVVGPQQQRAAQSAAGRRPAVSFSSMDFVLKSTASSSTEDKAAEKKNVAKKKKTSTTTAIDDTDYPYDAYNHDDDVSQQVDDLQRLNDKDKEEELEMPWTPLQEWALLDHLPKYVITIPNLGSSSQYALWRTLLNEVTELNGYPVEFVCKMHARSNDPKRAQSSSSSEEEKRHKANIIKETPNVLPYLDAFEFVPTGGVSGNVHGFVGIADGTSIQTPPLIDVELTVPKGYIVACSSGDDTKVAYELGQPATAYYSLDGTNRAATLAAARRAALDAALQQQGRLSSSSTALASAAAAGASAAASGLGRVAAAGGGDDEMDLLMKLGGSTAILLAGATAVSMLSHHLTVNVFWV